MIERIAGSLLGQAIGDALGRPVEGLSREICMSYVSDFMADRAAGVAEFTGQYTDDTQLARELAISLVENAGFLPSQFAARIARLFAEGGVVRPGRATYNAAERLQRGVPWDLAGEPPGAAGNGAAMRAAPIGWFFAPDSEHLVRVAASQASITHRDPDAQAGAAALAQAVAMAMQSHQLDDASFLQGVAREIASLSPSLSAHILHLHYFLPIPVEAAHAIISEIAGPPGEWAGTISPHTVPSVLWALYAYRRGRPNFLDVVSIAINGGGDADTTAAMAGALCGAEVGLAGLPDDLVGLVHDDGEWRAEQLINLAVQVDRCRGRMTAA